MIVLIGRGACSNSPTSKITLYIKDSIAFGHIKDTFVCSKFPTLLSAPYNDTSINKCTWSNSDTTRQTYAYALSNSFWVVHRFANNCYNVDTFHIVNGDPTVSVGSDVSFCYKDSVQVLANVLPTGGNFLWNTGSTADNIYVSTTGNFSVKHTAPNGCYLLDDMNATVKTYPFANLGNDTTLCSYESLIASAYYPGATYLWNTGATSSSIVIKDSGQYTVESTLNGCVARDTILVGPKKSPIVDAGADTAMLAGGRVKLMAVQYPNNYSYQWEPAMYLTYANSYNPVASAPVTMPFYLTVTSVDNCVSRDTIVVTVKEYGLNIPNSFSPNGDGVNDTWQIDLLSSYLFCKVQVFNRNGQVVFSSIGYEKPWDGTVNGKPLPSATYYYIVDPGYGKPVRTGSVTIIR